MKRSERKLLKSVLGVYNQCMSTFNRYMEPTILVDEKGIVRKVKFPCESYTRVLSSKISNINLKLK